MDHRRIILLFALLGAVLLAPGCGSGPSGGRDASLAYYQHRYPTARERVRELAADRSSNDVVLNNMRLGLASLADGDPHEAENALLTAYEYLTSGGVNAPDRAVASTVIHEGVRVWTGEPYEQAMSFYYLAALYMVRGDWENARAAASNSLFALRDFEGVDDEPPDMGEIVSTAARADRLGRDYLEEGHRLVESEFALGYLLVATNYVLMGREDVGERIFEQVRGLNPELGPLADELEAAEYDTLLLVDLGRGPAKQKYGPNDALVRYVPDGRRLSRPRLGVRAGGEAVRHTGGEPVVDLWTLSQYPRWWSLEPMRQAKGAIGDVLLGGGLVATGVGLDAGSREAVIAGLGAMAAGALLKGSAEADTRHLEMLPRCVYLVPLTLGAGEHDVRLTFEGDSGSAATWHDLRAGSPASPEVYYLRMHDGRGGAMPPWGDQPLYSVSVDGYRPGDRPWIMGGADLSPPGEELIGTYHEHGVLADMTLEELVGLYRGEGVVYQPGPRGRSGREAFDPELYRHLGEGGRALFSPRPGTHLYQRLTRLERPAYEPRGEPLRNILRNSFGQ